MGAALAAAWPVVPAMLFAALVYGNALHNPFVYDDYRVIVSNTSIVEPLTLGGLIGHGVTRPLVNISYAVDRALWGPTPFGFHVTNVALHVVNVALLYAVARRLRVLAFFAAVLFAVHPMMTEAVGYISGRSELLFGAFVLLAVLASDRWTSGWRWKVATLGCWGAGLLSKETAVVFPLIVAAKDVLLPLREQSERRERWRTLHQPLIVIAGAAAGVRLYVFLAYEYGGASRIVWAYLFAQVDVAGRYLSLLAWPRGQTVFHGVPLVDHAFSAGAIRSWLTAGGMAGGIWWLRRRVPVASLGLIWFAVMLIPSAALVAFNRGEPMAEHRVYLASAGFFLAIAALAGRAWQALARTQRVTRAAVSVAVGVFLAALAGRTIIRNAIWQSPVALWSESVELSPTHWYPRQLLGEALHDAGRHAEAVAAFQTSIARWPAGTGAWARAGVCLLELGRVDEAAATFGEVARLDPGSPDASNGLGAVALVRGDLGEARSRYQRTLEAYPDNPEARRGLAAVDARVAAGGYLK